MAQHELQIYYFLFQGFFILFLPIIGADFRSFLNEVLRDSSFSSLLAHLADRCLGRIVSKRTRWSKRFGLEQGISMAHRRV